MQRSIVTLIILIGSTVVHYFFITPRHLWEEEHFSKEKAQSELKLKLDELATIPDIIGTWQVIGKSDQLVTVTKLGDGIRTEFNYLHYRHNGKGSFNQIKRVFEIRTERIDATIGPSSLKSYPETWFVVSPTMFFFHAEKNAEGNLDYGFCKLLDGFMPPSSAPDKSASPP